MLTVDVRMWRSSGIGRVIRSILCEDPFVHSRIAVICSKNDEAEIARVSRLWRVIPCNAPIYSLREQTEIAWCARSASALWTPHFNIPMLVRCPVIATVHDMIHIDRWRDFGGVLKAATVRAFLNAVARTATVVAFPSEFSRSRFSIISGRISRLAVVPNGVDANFWSDGMLCDQEWTQRRVKRQYVVVGNIKKHKNLSFVLRAFAESASLRDAKLVVIGTNDGLRSADCEVIQRVGYGGVRWEQHCDDINLRAILQESAALIVPSLYEGFGLTVLEAMASGCPVICSTHGALPEVGGNPFSVDQNTGATMYFDTDSTDSLVQALESLDALSAEQLCVLRNNGIRRCAEFSWHRTAVTMFRLLEQFTHKL